MENSTVKVWQEKVIIPTYETGAPDKNPMFFEKRVYQGSSGAVYPKPVIEKIYDEKKDKEYTGLFLENQYLRIMILPEIGGRVQMAYDKIKQRHFIYYNQVIKPALVGLTGPWISGGIEFNWPQHHRPSSFEPVDYLINENEDGSKTVWVNEIDEMFHTKGMAGFTLYPGRAYLEIKAQLYNRTPLPQTFLWWANPAVKVNDEYQSVFPPDVNAVFDHGKRDVSTFPIATGTYYKVDYSPGTDISRYKNIPVPTSYMAIHSDYDFIGGYEHDTNAGVLHMADHHVSPGKKQWTWGCGDFGRAWDRNLTDEDGPYVELMAGVFTDNQPDFSWLMPYEEKSFTQYFLPYHELGVVKNATKNILVNVEKEEDEMTVKIYATSSQAVNIWLSGNGEVLLDTDVMVSPEKIFTHTLQVKPAVTPENILLIIYNDAGKEVLRYEPAKNKQNRMPEPAQAPLDPSEIETNEQLYLTGLHLEQYRHATYNPESYYAEALKRDERDIRNNNAIGRLYFRRGQFLKSEAYFRKAIETMTEHNSNPYDGEPYYNLGLCLKMQGRMEEAYDAFFKATWNNAWKDSGYFFLAQIDVVRNDYQKASEHIEESLNRNACNSKAYILKIISLRRQLQYTKALEVCETAVQKDKFNLTAYFEQCKIYRLLNDHTSSTTALRYLQELSGNHVQNYIEYVLDYVAAGSYEEALELLGLFVENNEPDIHPMVWYYMGWISHDNGKAADAKLFFEKAAHADADHCFPNRLEDIDVLRLAVNVNPEDAKAPYYLGNLWYDKKQYDEAIQQWELAVERDDRFPTSFRNLGIAYFNKRNDRKKAVSFYEKAFELDTSDARVLMELDQLYKRTNRDPAERLSFLNMHSDVALSRDDLYVESVALYNFLGNFEKAFELLMQRKFHPWEGGEGKVSGQYVYSLVEMAKKEILSSQFNSAIQLLEKAQVYPDNLGEGKLYGMRENDIFFWLGCAWQGVGDTEKAKDLWAKATNGLSEPAAAIFYNDQQPDKIFYQGLAWKKTGNEDNAREVFTRLITHGQMHRNDKVKIDYFAVSLPDLLIFEDDLDIRNRVHCDYMTGLGYTGLNQTDKAVSFFEKALKNDSMHFGAKTHLRLIEQWKEHKDLFKEKV